MDALLTTTKGKRLFLHEGYQYRYVSTTKREARNIYRCVDKGCKSRLHADAQGHVISIRNPHNHSENYSAAELRLHRRALLEAAIHGDDSRENILRSRQRLSTAANAPSYEADRRFITRKRAAPVTVAKLLNALNTTEPTNTATVTVLLRESNLDLSQVLQPAHPSTSDERNEDAVVVDSQRIAPNEDDSNEADQQTSAQQWPPVEQGSVDVTDTHSSSNAALSPMENSLLPAEYSNDSQASAETSETTQSSLMERLLPTTFDIKLHIRHILLWEWQCGTNAVTAAKKICDVLGERSISERTVLWWYQRFKSGKFSLEDEERADQPSNFDEDRLDDLICENPLMATHELAKQVNYCRSTVQNHLRSVKRISESRWTMKKRSKLHIPASLDKPMEIEEAKRMRQLLPSECNNILKAVEARRNVETIFEGKLTAENTVEKSVAFPKGGSFDSSVSRYEGPSTSHQMDGESFGTAEEPSETVWCDQTSNQFSITKDDEVHVDTDGSSDEIGASFNGIVEAEVERTF